jgi:hypothetical protein
MTGRLRAIAQEFGSESLCSLRQGKSDGGWAAPISISLPGSLSWPLTPQPTNEAAAIEICDGHTVVAVSSLDDACAGRQVFLHHLSSSPCSQFHSRPGVVCLGLAADCVRYTASSRLLGDAQLAQHRPQRGVACRWASYRPQSSRSIPVLQMRQFRTISIDFSI